MHTPYRPPQVRVFLVFHLGTGKICFSALVFISATTSLLFFCKDLFGCGYIGGMDGMGWMVVTGMEEGIAKEKKGDHAPTA